MTEPRTLSQAAAYPGSLLKNHGFSLVELSIVLVILGLLVGGTILGQSLIRAAELQSIGKEHQQWSAAVNNFKMKYNAIPGDMINATQFWASTSNGNGDGYVDDSTAASTAGEIFTFWQQLALARMITGEYTGIAGSGGGGPTYMDSLPGANVPQSGFPAGGWSVYWTGSGWVYTTDWYDLDYQNQFEVGSKISGYEMGDPLLTPAEAFSIDLKFDDGKPAKGSVIARYWNDRCAAADDGTSSATDFEASYRTTDDSVRCALSFRNAF